MINYLERIKKKVGLEEGEQVLEKILLEIYFHPGIPTKVLARKSFLPVPLVAAIKKEFIKAGVASKRGGIQCTSEGESFVEDGLGFQGIDQDLYSRIMDDHWDLQNDFQQTLITLNKLFHERPQVDVTLDQSKCTPETSLRRAILCLRKYALLGKEICCMGDDDLVSVSMGLLLQRLLGAGKYPASIHVIDIDNRFVKYIREIATMYSLPIQSHCVDLRQSMPDELQAQFDCVLTDPPYTLQGVNLFLSRGIAGLKKKAGLAIFLSFAHKSPEFVLNMQRDFGRMGLVISAMFPAFNEYEGAEIIGNTSQMIVLRTTSQTMPLITGECKEPIYTGEVRKTVRVYRCKKCQEVIRVGFKEAFKTIEELKKKGCPQCRNTRFDLVERHKIEIP